MGRRSWRESFIESYGWAIAGGVAVVVSRIDPPGFEAIVGRPMVSGAVFLFYVLLLASVILLGAAFDQLVFRELYPDGSRDDGDSNGE